MDALIKRLMRHEDLSLNTYPDRDKWAIGYGHQCEADHPPISAEQAVEYLMQDAHKASDLYMRWKAQHKLKLSQTRDEVLVEMIFWHGFRGFLGFRKMIKAILQGDYNTAADEMMDSHSGRTLISRMSELASLMRVG